MTRFICISSGKGGVGKTTLVANLSTVLSKMGKSVVVIDANVTTPNLGMHLGVPLYPKNLQDVLRGDAHLYESVYEHPLGMKVIPAGISVEDLKDLNTENLKKVFDILEGTADIVIIDSAAGLGREALASIESSDDLIVITNPELPAVIDALKTIKIAEEAGTRILGVVVNRVTGKKHELTNEQISSILDNVPILATIPEDRNVKEAISKMVPVVHHKPTSPASQSIYKLASLITGEKVEIPKTWYQKMFGGFF